MGSGGPIRPGAPLPPRDPGYQPPPGQHQHQPPPGQHQHQPPPGQHQPPRGGAGRHAAGPGYPARDGRRPGVPGSAGPAGPAEAAEQFDGGYAYVIRPSDNPVRPPSPARPPGFARPADPVRPADPEVYVYRDTDGQPGDPRAAVAGPDEHDAAYWYDLPGTGGREDTTPRVSQETRGPFEPLVSSADPPGTTPRSADRPADAEPAVSQEYTQARKLEQIKDLYLTAEAIGEANVDKHFDHLLVQQRELISDYFKQSNAARPEADGAGQAGAEDTQLTADQPRVW